MQGNYWVCKPDGTIQCQQDPEIPLAVMRDQLATLIGESEIIDQEKRSHQVIDLCGMSTGSVNAYQITSKGYWSLVHGVVGPQGFALCTHREVRPEMASEQFASEADQLTFSDVLIQSRATSVTNARTEIKDLIGMSLRVYPTGDPISKEYRRDRVNIEIDSLASRTIVDVWFG